MTDRSTDRSSDPSTDPSTDRSTDPSTDREALLLRYRELVDRLLPERARQGGWVITQDHCFGRVLLDDATGGCWYDALERGGRVPAYRQLDDAQLAHAVAQGEAVLQRGDAHLRPLNAQSLRWRRLRR